MIDNNIVIDSVVIPEYLQGSLKHTSKSKIKAANPSKYSLTFSRGEWVCHYTSESDSYAYGHAWFAAINKSYSPPDSWCLIKELQQGQLYFVWVKNDVVEVAKKCTPNSIDALAMQRADKIYFCGLDSEFITSIVNGADLQVIPDICDDDLKGYALKSSKKVNWRIIAAVVFTLFIILSFSYSQLASPENRVIQRTVVDPYADYKKVIEESLSASVTIDNAVNLAAYAALVPDGWSFSGVILQGSTVNLNIDRLPHGLRLTMVKWLESHKPIKSLGLINNDTAVINVPIQRGLNGWESKIQPVDDLSNKIKDLAVVQGWVVKSHTQTEKGNFKIQELALLNDNLTLYELRSISRLLASYPVSIKNLNLKSKAALGVVSAYLIIEFAGENNE